MAPTAKKLKLFRREIAQDYNATKLAATVIEAKLAGQKGIGLFARHDLIAADFLKRGSVPFMYEEPAMFTLDQPFSTVHERDLRKKFKSLTTAQTHTFVHLPTITPTDRTSLKEIFIDTIFGDFLNFSSCFVVYSLMNPSCTPNTRIMVNTFTHDIALFLENDASAGDELCYPVTHSLSCMTTAERRIYLQRSQGDGTFVCGCATCRAPDEIRRISDLRRCVMRHLLYLIKGCDLPDVEPTVPEWKQDLVGSRIWELHLELFDLLAEAERVAWLVPYLK